MVKNYEFSVKEINDLADIYQLAVEENNKRVIDETLKNAVDLRSNTKKNEIKCFLSNESDVLDCYIEIHAGAGEQKVKIGQKCLKECILNGFKEKTLKQV